MFKVKNKAIDRLDYGLHNISIGNKKAILFKKRKKQIIYIKSSNEFYYRIKKENGYTDWIKKGV